MIDDIVNKIVRDLVLFLSEDLPRRRFESGMRRIETIRHHVNILEQEFTSMNDRGMSP